MYYIQIFVSKNGSVGKWENTNFGGENLPKVLETAKKISQDKNHHGIVKVRVLELIQELDVINPKEEEK